MTNSDEMQKLHIKLYKNETFSLRHVNYESCDIEWSPSLQVQCGNLTASREIYEGAS